MTRYCIIGAGAAGLSAIHELTAAGYDVVCYEKSDRVGGHWHTDYEALHLITSRDMTHFRDFPMPASYPHFPRRDQVRDYIESFAEQMDLRRWIEFDTAVASIDPVATAHRPGSAGWRVRTTSGHDEDLRRRPRRQRTPVGREGSPGRRPLQRRTAPLQRIRQHQRP